jgi:uncharacterized membrane protein YoaK (UPF0700 family)
LPGALVNDETKTKTHHPYAKNRNRTGAGGCDAAVLLSAIIVFVLGNAAGIVIAHFAARRIFTVLACVSLTLALASLMAPFGLPIGPTYVTGALSRFGRGIGRWIVGDRRLDWIIQTVPWAGMLAGAVVGALLTHAVGATTLWVISVFAMLVALAPLLVPKPLQRRFRQVPAPRPASRVR